MASTLVSGSGASTVAAELTDIPHMASWPSLLFLIVVLLIVGLRNPYRRMFSKSAPARPRRRRRRARPFSTGRES